MEANTDYQVWYLNINGGMSDTSRNRAKTLSWLNCKLAQTSTDRKPAAICFCETKLKKLDKAFKIKGFTQYRLDCDCEAQRSHGGILIFVNDKQYSFVEVIHEKKSIEIEALGLCLSKNRRSDRATRQKSSNETNTEEQKKSSVSIPGASSKINLFCYYRRPGLDKEVFYNWLSEIFKKFNDPPAKPGLGPCPNNQTHLLLAGDANIDLDSSTKINKSPTKAVKTLDNILKTFEMDQLVTQKTRDGHNSSTRIDLVFTNRNSAVYELEEEDDDEESSKSISEDQVNAVCDDAGASQNSTTSTLVDVNNNQVSSDGWTMVYVTNESKRISDHKFLRIVRKKTKPRRFSLDSDCLEFTFVTPPLTEKN